MSFAIRSPFLTVIGVVASILAAPGLRGDEWSTRGLPGFELIWKRASAPGRSLASDAAYDSSSGRRRALHAPIPSPCAPIVVASPFEVGDMALDATHVYFIDGADIIARVPKNGGTPVIVAEVPGSLITSMTMDATTVFFTTFDDIDFNGSLMSVSKSGGTPIPLATELKTPFDVAVDGQFAYWAEVGTFGEESIAGDGAVGRVAKSGGTATRLASSLSTPFAVVTDGVHLYFAETGFADDNPSAGVRRVAVSGGPVERLTDGLPVSALAVDATRVYFSVLDFLSLGVEVRSIPKVGGTETTLATGLDDAAGLRVAGNTLYYAASRNEETSIEAVPLTGGTVRTIRKVALPSPEIAVDDCAIYFGTEDSTLERVPR